MNRTIRTTLAPATPPRSQSMRSARSRLTTFVALIAVLACSPINAKADTVLDWGEIAANTLVTQSAFAQARYMAITQLAVFEAVNAITGDYKPYLGTITAPPGASAPAKTRRPGHPSAISSIVAAVSGSNRATRAPESSST